MESSFSKFYKYLSENLSIYGFALLIKLNNKTHKYSFGQSSNMGEFVSVDGENGIMAYLLKNKSNKTLIQNNQKFEYIFNEEEKFKYIFATINKISNGLNEKTNEFIIFTINIIIEQFLNKKKSSKLTNDIYRLWDILIVTINHYINNDLFVVKGKMEILKTIYPDEKIINDLFKKINEISENINKLERQKHKLLSPNGKGIISKYIGSQQMINLDNK